MHEIRGKYNSALIMGDVYPDGESLKQIYGFLNHPAFKDIQIRIMVDFHAGSGCVIGYTATYGSYIIPSIVGYDIGCAVDIYNLGNIEIDFEKLDGFIRNNIPSGHHHRQKVHEKVEDFIKEYENLNRISEVSWKVTNQAKSVILLQAGTMGGNNHFIEVNVAECSDRWLSIHSGSRNFGLKVATYHQNKAKELMNKMFIGDAYKGLEFLPIDMGGASYLADMVVAQEFAQLNRQVMAYEIINKFFGMEMKECETIKSVHNYIDVKTGITRKGAISAEKGEKVIIPLNMRDGVIVGTGKGSRKWNNSAPHGAGRIMSRKEAKREIDIDEYRESMEGIWTSCVGKNTIDEAPQSYKNKEIIINAISETVDIDFILKPVYNFKNCKSTKEEE